MSELPVRYPVELDLRGRLAVVVGLGAVGRRRTLGLLEAGALVKGVDPLGWPSAPSGLEVIAEGYRREHLEGAFLVFATATVEVNRSVTTDALAIGKLVGSATDPGSGNLIKPAVRHDQGLILTVSTGGASPALARALRDRAAEALGPSASGLANVFRRLRPLIAERLGDPQRRKALYDQWGDPRWLTLFESGGEHAVTGECERLIEVLSK